MTEARIVLVTAPDLDTAARLTRTLVEEGLAACGNLVPGVRSIYAWEGRICDDAEVLVVLKTQASRWEALRDRIAALHPYTTPEILALPVLNGHAPYLRWLLDQTHPNMG